MAQNETFQKPTFPIKKYFYVLRPAVALRWLRLRGFSRIVPMNFQELVAESDLPEALRAIVLNLIAKKAVTREMGLTERIPAIDDFIAMEFEFARQFATGLSRFPTEDMRSRAESFFQRWLGIAEHTYEK
jgi:predicted nucleotidyltransferase